MLQANTFVQTLEATWPFYVGRLLGGLVFFTGMLVMAFNTYKTIQARREASAPPNAAVGAEVAS